MFKLDGNFWKTSAIHKFAEEIKCRGSLCNHIWLLDIMGWTLRASPFPGLSLVFLSGAILLVRVIGFPEIRAESKDAQENFPAVEDREPTLTQASLPMTYFFILTDDSLKQNAEMVLEVRTGIQNLLPS